MKVEVGELVNSRLPDVAAIHDDSQHSACRQIDASGSRRQFAATVAQTITILCVSAGRDAADGRARQAGIQSDVIAQHVHEAGRIGRQRSPDNRTYQRRQKDSKPAISVKVT